MAELTKIFTGMELGPEKIDANFKAVTDNIKAVEIKDTGWINLPIQASGWGGWLKVRKRGPEVRFNGELHPAPAEASNLTISTLPAGFTTVGFNVASAVNDYGTSFAMLIDGLNFKISRHNANDAANIRLNGTSFWE